MSIDLALHLAEIAGLVFWFGKWYGDLQWLKKQQEELKDELDQIRNVIYEGFRKASHS